MGELNDGNVSPMNEQVGSFTNGVNSITRLFDRAKYLIHRQDLEMFNNIIYKFLYSPILTDTKF